MSKMIFKRKGVAFEKYGKDPDERNLDELKESGVIVVDKHQGLTSSMVVDQLKSILHIDKAGHSGTLDPQVSGVLVIGLGKATKLMEYMLLSHKTYVCVMYIHHEVTDEALQKAINKFKGTIEQLPPIKSSVKRALRKRTVYDLDILEVKGQHVLFNVQCQHGTYIRKLCHDIGQELGVGAHMVELRRTKAGPFTEKESISLVELDDLWTLYKSSSSPHERVVQKLHEYILPVEEMIRDLKKVMVCDTCIGSLSYGADLAIPGVVALDEGIEKGDVVALISQQGELISMGKAYCSSNDVQRLEKGVFVKTNKVMIPQDYYPKFWKFSE